MILNVTGQEGGFPAEGGAFLFYFIRNYFITMFYN